MVKFKFSEGSNKDSCKKAIYLEGLLEPLIEDVGTQFYEQKEHIQNLEKRIRNLKEQIEIEKSKKNKEVLI